MKIGELKKVLHEAIIVKIYDDETDKLLYKGFVRNIEMDFDVIIVHPSRETNDDSELIIRANGGIKMSKKYRVTNIDSYEDYGLEVGDIVIKVEGSKRGNLYELPKRLHGKGHNAQSPDYHLKLKERNYLYIDEKYLEEIKENE